MRFASLLMMGVMCFSSAAMSAEKVVGDNNKISLDISVYNRSLALVKDVRKVSLDSGENNIAFEGVAANIKPETAILFGEGIKVLEQNYDYDLLNAENLAAKSVGETVKTVVTNPSNGENVFDKAEIISAGYGRPVLKFNYGVDPDFPGRLVYDKIPSGLRNKPTLVAKLISDKAENKDVSLAYLTNGISWKTNYVVNVADLNKLNMTGWVTINNESGVDYNNARVQLIAGDVNEVREFRAARPMMLKVASFNAAADDMALAEGASEEELGGYHLYNLPNKTTIKDKQTKQISLIEKNGVKYKKEANISSQLYFNPGSRAEFKQVHPDMYYIINNKEEDNLGFQLPAGIVRFYEKDEGGNLQFIGENSIGHVAKGETMRLRLGNFVNIFANGKITSIEKLSEKPQVQDGTRCKKTEKKYLYKAEVSITNSGKNAQEVVYTQNLPMDALVTTFAPHKGTKKQSGVYEWRVNVPADGTEVITFSVTAPHVERVCD